MRHSTIIAQLSFRTESHLIIVATFTSISTLAVAFLLRFLIALRNDTKSIIVAPHLRVGVRRETMPEAESASLSTR
jgi:hypothetical protein